MERGPTLIVIGQWMHRGFKPSIYRIVSAFDCYASHRIVCNACGFDTRDVFVYEAHRCADTAVTPDTERNTLLF